MKASKKMWNETMTYKDMMISSIEDSYVKTRKGRGNYTYGFANPNYYGKIMETESFKVKKWCNGDFMEFYIKIGSQWKYILDFDWEVA